MATLDSVTAEYGNVIALAINTADGAFEVYDYMLTWETAQAYANDGYRIVVINDDGAMTKDELQQLCNAEFDRAVDCFGEGHVK